MNQTLDKRLYCQAKQIFLLAFSAGKDNGFRRISLYKIM